MVADKTRLPSFQTGLLAQEVESFKSNCRSKASAASELAQNVAQECIIPLRKLI